MNFLASYMFLLALMKNKTFFIYKKELFFLYCFKSGVWVF